MKRTTPSSLCSVYAYLIVLGLSPFPAHGLEEASLPASRLLQSPIPSLNPAIAPSSIGGDALSGLPALPPAASIEEEGPLARMARVYEGLDNLNRAVPQAMSSARQLSGSISQADEKAGAEGAQAASNAAFDNADSNGAVNGGGDGNGDGGAPSAGDGQVLGNLYPRVVMILDAFKGPASDSLVKQIETLADKGVRVVFVTARPDRGENSAESVLVSKLRVRKNNPVIVVSYNGARVTAHSSKSENPKPLIADQPGFPQNTIEQFRKFNAAISAKLGLRANTKEFTVGDAESPLIYGLRLPATADLGAYVQNYNRALRGFGYKYKVEGVEDENGKYLYTQSTALKLNTNRIFQGLYAQYPELRENLTKEQVLVLADSTKAVGFLKALSQEESVSGRGFFIHGATDSSEVESALGAVLGTNALEKVKVVRSQLRAYTEWLDARTRYGAPRSAPSFSGSNGRYYRDLGFYRGILLYDLMGRLYHFMRKGQYAEASPEAAQALLERMWYQPRNNGVRISDEMDAMRHSGRWKALQRGYLETAKVWVRNYYHRNFKDFPNGVSEKVVGTMINLSRDSKNSITLEYASPYTGRRYMVGLLPARAHLERDDKGNVLVAHVYRSGKEPFETQFQDSIERNLLGRAMLQGYASKGPDGRWYVNDEPNPRVKVVFHYMTRDLGGTDLMTPEEIEGRTAEVTTMIEKMNSDKEFLDYWADQEARNNKVSAGIEKRKNSPAKPKPKAKLKSKKKGA